MKAPSDENRDDIVAAMRKLKKQIADKTENGECVKDETAAFNSYARRLIDIDSFQIDNPNNQRVIARKGARPAHLEFYVGNDGEDVADANWRYES